MTPKTDSLFLEFDLTLQDQKLALSSPLLLAYLQSKRAAYASNFMQSQLHKGADGNVDAQTSLIQLAEQRAKIAILTEILDEAVALIESDDDSEDQQSNLI